eukprot:PhF_6_TR24445/c0_g1_i3/m.33803
MRRAICLFTTRGSRPMTAVGVAEAGMTPINAEQLDMRQPTARPNETVEQQRRRLLYQSTYRGMAEMDYILGSYAEQNINTMNDLDLKEWELVIRQYDSELYKWIIQGQAELVPKELADSATWSRLMHHSRDAREFR